MQGQELIRKGEGENYNYSQDHCFIKLSSQQTNGELSMVEDRLKPGFHLKRHLHKIMTEVFYMLEGELKLIFDDETIVLGEEDTMTVAPNIWHEAICMDGRKMLTLSKNSQFDLFLEELPTMTDEDFSDKEQMLSLSAKYDIYEE